MAQIHVTNLTFHYEGSYDNVFEKVSFSIDTNWKLGFIGRNGKGKTTFLNLLLGKYDYQGTISSSECFDYFPYQIPKEIEGENTMDVVEYMAPGYELWKVCRELELLKVDGEVLYRPYETLSYGERTKIMLAVLFSEEHRFLLIDEPTNHLDMASREILPDYLKGKKGYLLVSHDRWLLDACVDHVLVLNRTSIEVVKGTFTSWWENKERQDAYEQSENERLKREIGKLEASARKTAAWADKVERTKIGFDPVKEPERNIATRAYIGEKSRRMQQRRKNLERRQQADMEKKQKLLKDMEKTTSLKMTLLSHHRERYVSARDLCIVYNDFFREESLCNEGYNSMEKIVAQTGKMPPVVEGFQMELKRGDRVLFRGKNGSGKSSIIKALLHNANTERLGEGKEERESDTTGNMQIQGILEVAHGLKISYMNQSTSHLQGKLDDYIEKNGVNGSLFKAILRQLDFERIQFEKNMENYSEGQKKKVLIAASLAQQAHLYIWDEPLNYIDVFSRMQLEELILNYQPTMLLVEHDLAFCQKVATKIIEL